MNQNKFNKITNNIFATCLWHKDLTFIRLFGVFATLICLRLHALGQGTTQTIGFEEFGINETPPFVRGNGLVSDGTSTFIPPFPPFEGTKYLGIQRAASIASPDGKPIQSYTLHLFMPPMPPNAGNGAPFVQIGGQFVTVQNFSTWSTFQGSFTTPVQSLDISAATAIEGYAVFFGVDSIQFVTIPEPEAVVLIAFGLGAIALSPKIRNSKIKQR